MSTGQRDRMPSSPSWNEREPPSARVPKTAMIVDDSEEYRALLSVALRARGFAVISITDEALVFTTILASRPTVLVLDVNMPGIDGPRLCRMVRKLPQGEHLPIILCSAADDLDAIAQGCGATAYITKTIPVTEIARRVFDLVERGAPSSKPGR